jgi:hypothetical protein
MKLVLACVSGLVLVGCVTPSKIGTACEGDEGCNIAGQVCAAGPTGGEKICTRKCTGNTGEAGCPVGFDCTKGSVGFTCNKVKYSVDPTTGVPTLYGKSCSIDANACNETGDPNPSPSCRKGPDTTKMPVMPLMNDPAAYCTGTCEKDTDCPNAFECFADWDMVKKCLRRSLCTPCEINDDCPQQYPSCITTASGGKYCSKPCATAGDCPGTTQGSTWMQCKPSVDSLGNEGGFCQHHYGKCIGDGQPCAPCRVKADCGSGLSCFENDATLEKFCTKRCSVDSDCATTNTMAPSICDNIMPTRPSDPSPTLLCTGDTTHEWVGNPSCWF